MELLTDALHSFPDVLLLLDRTGTVHGVSGGHGPERITLPTPGSPISSTWPAPIAQSIVQALRRVLKDRRPYQCFLTLPSAASGTRCELRFAAQGRERVLLLVRSAASLPHTAASSEASAERDSETGLLNRKWFADRAVDRFNQARLREEHAAVLVIEFPQIDTINANFGRRVGAELLKIAVDRVRARVRQGRDQEDCDDIALVARDAIALVLAQANSRPQVAAVAQRVRDALDGPFAWEGREFNLRSGIGIAMFPRDGEDIDALLRNAHMALSESAFARSSSAVFYSDTMPLRSLARLDVQDELRMAIEQGQLSMRFTPWLRTEPLHVTGLAVSPSLSSPIRGQLDGDRLMLSAESAGLSRTLLDQTLDAAMVAVPRLLDSTTKGAPQRARLLLHLHASQLHRDLPTGVMARCRRHRVQPAQVYLSVPEHVLLQGDLVDILTALRKQGLRVLLRDFGAEQVRLAELATQPLWGVQLADCLINGARSQAGQRTCRAVTELARALGLKVTGAGIRTAREASMLTDFGCTDLSGPLYGADLAESELSAALATYVGEAPSYTPPATPTASRRGSA